MLFIEVTKESHGEEYEYQRIVDGWVDWVENKKVHVEVLDYASHQNGLQVPHETLQVVTTEEGVWTIVNKDAIAKDVYSEIYIGSLDDELLNHRLTIGVFGISSGEKLMDYVIQIWADDEATSPDTVVL